MPINLRPTQGQTAVINSRIDFTGPEQLVLTQDTNDVALTSHLELQLLANTDQIFMIDGDNNGAKSEFKFRTNGTTSDLVTIDESGNVVAIGALQAASAVISGTLSSGAFTGTTGTFTGVVSGDTPAGLGTAGAAGKFVPLDGSGKIPSAALPAGLTADVTAALAGTQGSPSNSNRYVTNSDTRLTVLTAGVQQALVGTAGTPNTTNKFVTDQDSRLSNLPNTGRVVSVPGASTAQKVLYGTGSLTTYANSSSVNITFSSPFTGTPVVMISPNSNLRSIIRDADTASGGYAVIVGVNTPIYVSGVSATGFTVSNAGNAENVEFVGAGPFNATTVNFSWIAVGN